MGLCKNISNFFLISIPKKKHGLIQCFLMRAYASQGAISFFNRTIRILIKKDKGKNNILKNPKL